MITSLEFKGSQLKSDLNFNSYKSTFSQRHGNLPNSRQTKFQEAEANSWGWFYRMWANFYALSLLLKIFFQTEYPWREIPSAPQRRCTSRLLKALSKKINQTPKALYVLGDNKTHSEGLIICKTQISEHMHKYTHTHWHVVQGVMPWEFCHVAPQVAGLLWSQPSIYTAENT